VFDPENKIVKLCADGMLAEGQGNISGAKAVFELAWHEAVTAFEKFTAAHFVARQQENITEKLKWDKIALDMAHKVSDVGMKSSYPSLYLNIGKCYEDLHNPVDAKEYYLKAFSFMQYLSDDGYGKMIRSGILAGMERMDTRKF